MRLLRILLLSLLVVISVRAEEEDEYECVDLDSRCEDLASIGECVRNSHYMKENCPVSCLICEEESDEDDGDDEEEDEEYDGEGEDEESEDEEDGAEDEEDEEEEEVEDDSEEGDEHSEVE